MATKQTDTVAMTDEQLDGVSGGPHYSDWKGSRHNVIQRRRSNRTRYTENDNTGASRPVLQFVSNGCRSDLS